MFGEIFNFKKKKSSSMGERNMDMLKTGRMSDCKFRVGILEERDIDAHKLILASASPVFETMFFGSMPENTEQPIVIADIEGEDFYDFLAFIYTDRADFKNVEHAVKLYSAAHKYMVEPLKLLSVDFIAPNLNVMNVCGVLNMALDYDIEYLKKLCITLIKYETSTVLYSDQFFDLNISALDIIMSQKDLDIFSELELFKALESYATKRIFSNLRQMHAHALPQSLDELEKTEFIKNFTDIVKKIRFRAMSPSEFASGPAVSRILSKKDALNILICITDSSNMDNRYPNGFIKTSRCRNALMSKYLYFQTFVLLFLLFTLWYIFFRR